MPKNLKDSVEFIGIVAIIVGLFFVYIEMRQNGTIARAQLSSETNQIRNYLMEREQDKDFSQTLAKSFESPESLTSAERRQMNSYLNMALSYTYRERHYYRLGLFDSWNDGIAFFAPYYFGAGYGRTYWDAVKAVHNSEVVAAIDEALTNEARVEYFEQLDSDIVRRLRAK